MLGLTLESKKFKIDWMLAGQWERLNRGLAVKGLRPCVDRVAIFQWISFSKPISLV